MTKTKRTFVTLNVTDGPSHQEILESLTPPVAGRGHKPPATREFIGTFKDASDPSEVVKIPMLLRGALYKSRGDNDTLQVFGAVLVGVINAVGGGVLRDILSGVEPRIYRPSQWYAIISVGGSLLFLALAGLASLGMQVSAIIAIATMVIIRAIVIVFDIKTRPAESVRNIVRGKKQP